MTDSSHLAAPSSGRTSGNAAIEVFIDTLIYAVQACDGSAPAARKLLLERIALSDVAAPLAVEDGRERCASSDAKDAARYRWLRDGPYFGNDYITTNIPWVVHIERERGVPTMQAISREKLDAAIDAAMAAASSGKEKME